MRSKFILLPCLSVILLGLSSQGRGLSLIRESSPQQQTDTRKDLQRRVVPNAAGASSTVRIGHAQTGHTLPLAVDGAVHPELIPDDVAYRHFISITALSATASQAEVARRDAFLAQVQLSPADRGAYLAALTNVREGLTSIEQQRRLLGPADLAGFDALRQQQGQLLDTAAARALAALTADGVSRLQGHIRGRVKSHIRIYGQLS